MSLNALWRRPFVRAVAAGLLGISLVGPAVAPGHARAAGTTIVFWSHDNPSWVKSYKALIAGFEKVHPEIAVRYQIFTYDGLLAKLTTALGTSAAPDAFDPFGTWVTAYARAGKVDPVPASVATAAQMQAAYFPAAAGAGLYNGKYYSLPHDDAGGAAHGARRAAGARQRRHGVVGQPVGGLCRHRQRASARRRRERPAGARRCRACCRRRRARGRGGRGDAAQPGERGMARGRGALAGGAARPHGARGRGAGAGPRRGTAGRLTRPYPNGLP